MTVGLIFCDYSDLNGELQVDKLDKNAISEVKAYNKPPKAVETVLSAAMTLFGQPTDWANSKKVGRHWMDIFMDGLAMDMREQQEV